MYRIFWLNFDYFSASVFDSVEEAIQFAKSRCFEALIVTPEGSSVAVWSPIGGTKYYNFESVS